MQPAVAIVMLIMRGIMLLQIIYLTDNNMLFYTDEAYVHYSIFARVFNLVERNTIMLNVSMFHSTNLFFTL